MGFDYKQIFFNATPCFGERLVAAVLCIAHPYARYQRYLKNFVCISIYGSMDIN